MENVSVKEPAELADIIINKSKKILIIDARTFCEYNAFHIISSVNFWSSKIRKKRLQQNSISVQDFLQQSCPKSLQDMNFEEVIVYDQSATFPDSVPPDTFLYILLIKLISTFNQVFLLKGGFLEFQSQYYEMCEASSQKGFLLTSFSQPCMSVANNGPTKILPFLFLGSQYDANNKELLLVHDITYELNVSTSCPKPDFLQDQNFLRVAVNDNFNAKLLPHFGETYNFIEKVRKAGGKILVHCLAGISRSPTIVISYVMKYLQMHYDEAYRYVKACRPTISPNINFVGQLLEFDLHIFGNKLFFRSSPDNIYPNDYLEHCHSCRPSPRRSILSKSSSSSCLDSWSDPDLTFTFNKSLPSLHLSKSVEEKPHAIFQKTCCTQLQELNHNIFDRRAREPTQGNISDQICSSPIFQSDSSQCQVSFSFSREETSDFKKYTAQDSRNKEEENTIYSSEDSLDKRNACENIKNKYSYVTVGNIQDFPNVPVLDVKNYHKKEEKIGALPKLQQEFLNKVYEPSFLNRMRNHLSGNSLSYISNSKYISFPYTFTNEDVKGMENASLLYLRTFKPPIKKTDDGNQVARSYSSSEAVLATRTHFENQAACNQKENSTKKSFSSDEVCKGYQNVCISPTSPSMVYGKESCTNPLDLLRCDSWSTSGLGSEISDWDSVPGDTQSLEDTQGPYDAVFAEVFLGECQSSLHSQEPIKKYSEEKDGKSINEEEEKFRDIRGMQINSTSANSMPSESTPTPRPASLPGVSGMYNIGDKHLISDKVFKKDNNYDSYKKQAEVFNISQFNQQQHRLMEHPPVNPRTMGEDVKYIMTWYKMDSNSQANSPTSESNPASPGFKFERADSSELEESTKSKEKYYLNDRCQWRDKEFKKKVENIKKNVSLTSWDSLEVENTSEDDNVFQENNPAGLNLALELVQSMEDLLEREMTEIKKQVSSLSTHFGLTLSNSPSVSLKHWAQNDNNDEGPSFQQDHNLRQQNCRNCISLGGKKSKEPCANIKVDDCPLSESQYSSWCKNESKKVFGKNLPLRARSEPPLRIEEKLYRAKSCPGISQFKNNDELNNHHKREIGITVCFPNQLCTPRDGHSKRFSCSALDFPPLPQPMVESCTDVRELCPFKRGIRAGSSGSSGSNCSSTQSSFSRLLKVS